MTINEKNFRLLEGQTVVDKSTVNIVCDRSLPGLSLNRMVLGPGGIFSYVSESSVATVLQGGGLIVDQDTQDHHTLNPGSTYTIHRGTTVEIRNTMQMELIISFVNLVA